MSRRVAIVGIGYTPVRAVTPELSYKELTFEAAGRAYADVGISAGEVQSFVTCAEDFNEGTSIFDEYTPDQLGGAQKPMHTVGGDGLHGIADAAMQIMTGAFDLVVVEAHSKASNLLTPHHILNYALDPTWNRPLGVNPHYVAGLEMNRFLYETGETEKQCAAVVVKNKRHARDNPSGVHAAALKTEQVLKSAPAFSPLKELEISPSSDAAVVVVLAGEERAKKLKKAKPIWLRGISWANDTPTLESRDWAQALAVKKAASKAYAMSGIKDPRKEIDFFEVDDTYAYKELQHLEALGVFVRSSAGEATERGETERTGTVPVNVSGGSLGCGNLLEATGLFRVAEAVEQLRGQAGKRQVPSAKVGLVQSWRGVPTTSAAVAILAAE